MNTRNTPFLYIYEFPEMNFFIAEVATKIIAIGCHFRDKFDSTCSTITIKNKF